MPVAVIKVLIKPRTAHFKTFEKTILQILLGVQKQII